jgi:XTP/dITP diphosphohydrolase
MDLSKQPIIFLSTNQNKLEELQAMMAPAGISISLYSGVFDVEEDGDTFEANAYKKLMGVAHQPGVVYLAEDSGLCVDDLGGRPGIFSARYGGDGASNLDRCRLILEELAGVESESRGAQFVCGIAVRGPNGETQYYEGCVRGRIASDIQGENGFGYDPIFIPDGYSDTLGVLPAAVKHTLSHRAQAVQHMLAGLASSE